MNRIRTRRNAVLLLLLLCLAGVQQAFAQQDRQQDYAQLAQALREIKAMKVYHYDFTVKGTFPDGATDQVKGHNYFDGVHKRYFLQSNEATVLLSGEWYYRAEHSTRRVSVINLKTYAQKQKEAFDYNALFSQELSSLFIDSVLLKYGRLSSLQVTQNRLHAEVVFSPGSQLRSIVLDYNLKEKLPVSVSMQLVYPHAGTDQQGRPADMEQEIVYSGYGTDVPEPVFRTEPYFIIRDGKALLKQYTAYKLYSIL